MAVGSRICVLGTSGAGKTTVARRLAEKLGYTYVSNDSIIWDANWTPVPKEEVAVRLEKALAGDDWTFDGNVRLRGRPDDLAVLNRVDTFVWLDLPRWQVHSQVLWRTLRRLLFRQKLWHGNVETWRMFFSRDSIVWWSLKTYAGRRHKYADLLADAAYADRHKVHLKSRREVDRWLRAMHRSLVDGSNGAGDALR